MLVVLVQEQGKGEEVVSGQVRRLVVGHLPFWLALLATPGCGFCILGPQCSLPVGRDSERNLAFGGERGGASHLAQPMNQWNRTWGALAPDLPKSDLFTPCSPGRVACTLLSEVQRDGVTCPFVVKCQSRDLNPDLVLSPSLLLHK